MILNPTIWFACMRWHYGGKFDYFVAIVAIGAMERFKIGVIPTLAVCVVLGMIWKLM